MAISFKKWIYTSNRRLLVFDNFDYRSGFGVLDYKWQYLLKNGFIQATEGYLYSIILIINQVLEC